MSKDEQVVPSATEDSASEDAPTSAETEKPEVMGDLVPKAEVDRIVSGRLSEMAAQRREAKEESARLQARIEELEVKAQTEVEDDDSPDEVKQAQKLILKTIEKELGMPLKDARAKITAGERAERTATWTQMCQKSGVDPTDTTIQGIVQGLATVGKLSVEDALAKAVKLTGVKGSRKKDVASAETDSMSGVATSSDWIPKNASEAIAGAKQGKKARQLSSVEIIERRQAR